MRSPACILTCVHPDVQAGHRSGHGAHAGGGAHTTSTRHNRHNHHSHRSNMTSNSVVAHLEEGLEIIHLFTGVECGWGRGV